VKVYAANGEIVVTAPAVSDIKVFSANGAQIYTGQGSNVTIPTAKGIYVVNVDGKATKVTVF